MIVRTIMTTQLVTVAPDDTLAHAATLLRQHKFHHLPVTRKFTRPIVQQTGQTIYKTYSTLEGLLTAQDIDLVAALARQEHASHAQPWQERLVVEIMHSASMRVAPTTSVAAAAQLMVERNLNYLPVVEYEQIGNEQKTLLTGLVTRSDLLTALARSLGAFEPGMQLDLALPLGEMQALARTLLLAAELHIPIRSISAVPDEDGTPRVATLRLGTINPTPLLMRLQEEGISYANGPESPAL